LLTAVVDIVSRLAAAENPPLSTTRTNAVMLVNRSIQASIIPARGTMLPIVPGLSHRLGHCICRGAPAAKFAQEEQARHDDLMKTGSGTIQRARQTDSALRAKVVRLAHGRSGLFAAQKKADVLTTERRKAEAQVDQAKAVERQMALNLSCTAITAPVDGMVGARSLRVGPFVQAATWPTIRA
jgi:multidrug resistance efflux pump